jgi:stress-induced morphogen
LEKGPLVVELFRISALKVAGLFWLSKVAANRLLSLSVSGWLPVPRRQNMQRHRGEAGPTLQLPHVIHVQPAFAFFCFLGKSNKQAKFSFACSIDVVSPLFEGKSSMNRQRMVYKAIWQELQGAVHAVDAMTTKTPSEAGR